MAKRISLSQYKSKLRQLQNKQKQAINKYNQEVRKYNQKVNQAINKYNQDVRAHNSRVRANRQRLITEMNKLANSNSTRHVVYHRSVVSLNNRYVNLDSRSESGSLDSNYDYYLDLSEKETANSAEVLNSLSHTGDEDSNVYSLTSTLNDELIAISIDLDNRWKGAVFSLNPKNPDAARHFCTSAREVFTQILEIKAPDNTVISQIPNCDTTEYGKPTRRAKIKYLLHQKGLFDEEFGNFVDEDVNNILELFRVFNDGTHGSSGTYNFQQLVSIKKRVEDGIIFLSNLVQ
ncbi:hypothetical protein [Fulvivirga sp.]|uniref:pPIWI-associating nuclease domain-containing protein n=1 Tax=Fulvivirga sp. TaxID=1931237 RepID=UPI0032EEA09B